jgi:hypothetical protein
MPPEMVPSATCGEVGMGDVPMTLLSSSASAARPVFEAKMTSRRSGVPVLVRLRGDGVGIGIEGGALSVVRQGSDDGCDASLDESLEHVAVGRSTSPTKPNSTTVFQRGAMNAMMSVSSPVSPRR